VEGRKGGCFQPFIRGFNSSVAASDFICGFRGLVMTYMVSLGTFGNNSEAAVCYSLSLAASEIW